MEAYTSESLLEDYLRVIFRHKLIIITVLITAMVIVFIRFKLNTPMYKAEVKILVTAVKQTEGVYYQGIGPRSLIQTQMELAVSGPVIKRVVEALKLYERPRDYEKEFTSRLKAFLIDYRLKKSSRKKKELSTEQERAFLFNRATQRLRRRIKTDAIERTDVFTISISDFSSVEAAKIVNSVSRSYVIFDLEQQIAELELKYGVRHSVVIQLKSYIEDFQKTLDGRLLPDLEAIGPASIKIIEQARGGAYVPLEPGQNTTLILTFFASIFTGILLAFVLDYVNQTFKSPNEVKTFLKIPFLGSIPKNKSKGKLLIKASNPATKYAQSFQNISDQIYVVMKDKNLKSILITDAEGSESITTVIANIGVHLAHKAGLKVLILDANLRAPSISKTFSIANSPGLTDLLDSKTSFEDTVQDLGSHLHVLPAGEAVTNPITLLNSSIMSDVIKKAEEQYEIVFISCLDLRNFTDAVLLSSITDATAFVVNEGRVQRQVAKTAIASLEMRNVNLIGAILNNRTYVIPKLIYKLMIEK